MRFYNKYDGPPKNLGHQIFAYGLETQQSFQKCLTSHGYPTASLGGKIIGHSALGSVVTQFYN